MVRSPIIEDAAMTTGTPDPQGPAVPEGPNVGRAQREYGHSSGDRNTRSKEDDWPELHGGEQRNATPTKSPPGV